MGSGTFQERNSIAFMLDIMFKPRILILKISENLFIVFPTGFESDLNQTTNALSFLFYPKNHRALWIPGLFISFSKWLKGFKSVERSSKLEFHSYMRHKNYQRYNL